MTSAASSSLVDEISVRDLFDRFQSGETVDLIDVRTPAEFQAIRVEAARLISLESFDPKRFLDERGERRDQPLYVICGSGGRSRSACQRLRAEGLSHVVNVQGGTIAWEAAGLPVVRGARRVMAMERQVRIGAGSFVAVGTVLGAFVHPIFLGIPAFIGSGLVFSGVTDTCGMAMILARMPWNQVR